LEPYFETLSFENVIQLFKGWGFLVEPGPGTEEVTLVLERPAHRSYCVYKTGQRPQIAAAALRVRWRSPALLAPVLDVKQKVEIRR
jgi:hypothetical protein